MSASPSLPSVDRSKWKKRRRDTEIVVKRRTEEDDEEDDEDEDFDAEDDEDRVTADPSISTTRETEVLSEGGVRISDFPVAIRHNVNRPHSSVLEIVEFERSLQRGVAQNLANPIFLENVSYGQLLAVSSVTANGCSSNQDIKSQIHSRYGILKRFMNFDNHIVPMHADWFLPTGVHRLERQVVPHFFSGKSSDNTPEKYARCRNSMISMYLENPEKRLLVTDCQKSSDDTSVEDSARIFRFLDSWGVINYCASTPEFEPCSVSHLREDVNGDLLVPTNALKSINSLMRFDIPKCRLTSPDGYISGAGSNNGASDFDSRIREKLSDYHCYFCFRPVPVLHYQSQKQADVLLCTDCFHDGKFVVGHSSIDFLRVDLPNELVDTDSESWTDQETLLLLEAVEKYNDNWNEITEHIGTKSKSQCILHFIGLPVGGRLDNLEIPITPGLGHSSTLISDTPHLNSNGGSLGFSMQFPESEYRIPFANSKNPVMSLVAFLTSALGPRVAAACAHALLTVLSSNDHPEATLDEGEVPTPLPAEKVESAVRAGVGAAAIKAKLFAEHEEREIQRLSANIVNQQLKKLELKLRQFAEVEMMLMKECEQVERARQRFAAERARIVSTCSGPSGMSPTLAAVGPNMVNSGPMGSQPVLSGFGIQQPHSRPLLAAPAAANFVFSASGNPQQAHSSS